MGVCKRFLAFSWTQAGGPFIPPLLFVLVMDCLGRLMDQAQEHSILSPIGNQIIKHRASIYADDVVTFSKPDNQDISSIASVLDLFGRASGLGTNMAKSKILPIRCEGIDLTIIQNSLGCQIDSFPCIYLGMPLWDKRLKRIFFQGLLDKIAKKLAAWKARWITLAGRTVLVRFVLSAMPIFQLISVKQPKWFIKQIDKMRRAFLWVGSDAVSGGKCLIKRSQVCSPLELGGLGIPDLICQGRALRVRSL